MTKNLKKNKKEIIRKAAIKVISKNGFHNTKISQIAKAGEIAVGTIYNYFDSKEAVLDYIFKVELKKRIKLLETIEKSKEDFWEKMDYFLQKHFQEIEDNIETAKVLIREKEIPGKMNNSSITEYKSIIPQKIKKLMDEAVNNEEIRDCNTEIISLMLFGSIRGLLEKAIETNNFEILNEAPSEIMELYQKGLSI